MKISMIKYYGGINFRYVRVLGAFYLRLTGIDSDIYRYLEPLYNDYRKVRRKSPDGSKFFYSFSFLSPLISPFRFHSVSIVVCIVFNIGWIY